jgi:ubiquinone/menaquinone biosynthesis C-methylase UbiE
MDDYTCFAKLYDPVIGPFLKPIHQAMLAELSSLQCHKITDLCCGTGLMAGMISDAGMKAVGVDLSQSMLRVARKKHPAVTFLDGDATSLIFSNGEFDAATISFALHERPESFAFDVLKEAQRVVKPGGLILVADYRQPASTQSPWTEWAITTVERLAGKNHYAHYKKYMEKGGTESMLIRAGLAGKLATTFMNGWVGLYIHQI